MYQYIWDVETGGLLLTTEQSKFSKEPRPVYYKELDILGFDQYWNYPKDDHAPLMWAEANNYIYRGRTVAKVKNGSLYHKPELFLMDEPEPDGQMLQFVDIDAMIYKNQAIMETLVHESIQKVYNTYRRYKKRVDIFHVSFSGGKDSVVTLDLVQRTLPHDDFVVIFGDTGMEFPDTYQVVSEIEKDCKNQQIKFIRAKADIPPLENWKIFGPPSKTIRWCCSVHKTTPQLLSLRKIVGKDDMIEMAFVGIRADESVKRSGYDYVSLGTKHKGQYSCNPILEWSSAEIYLYIYGEKLILNEAYKKGNSRAGCLVCPMAGEHHEHMRYQCYPNQVNEYIDVIKQTNGRDYPTAEDTKHFIEVGGWKVRNNGRDIKSIPINYRETSSTELEVVAPAQNWKIWLKTVGVFYYDGENCTLSYGGKSHQFKVIEHDNWVRVILDTEMIKKEATLARIIKQVFRKAAYCIGCKECQADCPFGCLKFIDGKVNITDNCRHCLNCHKPASGCLLYKSLEQPKGNGKMNTKAIDCYADHAPKLEWIESFFNLQERFIDENTLGSVMISMFKRFLRDAELLENNKPTNLVKKLDKIGITTDEFWAIMLVNLSYSPEVGWYIQNMPFFEEVKKDRLIEMLKESGAKDRGAKSASGAFRRIVSLPFGEKLGLGTVTPIGRSFGITRGRWENPVPEVVLYALYKFAEACDGYYQFSLETLLDDSIERDGISPTRIFGLDKENMVRILNGLSINYPDFISASFTLDLDNITLREDKTADDVLQLF